MEKMTWQEAHKYLCDFNKKHNIDCKGIAGPRCTMIAVISQDSFDEKYSLEERSYVYNNDNKAFMSRMGGYSIFASNLDGSDVGVRLEQYIEDEGNPGGWKVEYCYIKSEDD